MSAEAATLTALFSHLNSPAIQSPALSIAWPDVAFTVPTPEASARWLRVTLLRADTFGLAVTDGANRYSGLLQIDVFAPLGVGEKVRTDIAELIVARFKKGTRITSGGFTIEVIQPPSLLPLQKDDPWAFIPVRVPWVCFAQNPA